MKVSRFKLAFAVLLIVTILRRVWASAASLKHGIDLNATVKAFPHVKYQPKVFPGARL